MMGPERRSMVISDNEKRLTAIHEAGHALVGMNIKESDPVQKVTIVPRGRALGRNVLPARSDILGRTKEELLAMIATQWRPYRRRAFHRQHHDRASNDIEKLRKWPVDGLPVRNVGTRTAGLR